MAVSTGYDYGIRQGLVGKGVSNNSIGYNPSSGHVTIDGNNFQKADKVYQNTSFTNQGNFNNAWDNYSKSLNTQSVAAPPTTLGTGVSYQPPSTTTAATQTNSTQDQYNNLIDILTKAALNPQKVSANDVYQSPQYAAYQAQADRDSAAAVRAAQESYGSAGFGRSYGLGERSQGIKNDSMTYMNSQVLPQLMQQAQLEQQQNFQNQFTTLDKLQSSLLRDDNLKQNEFSNSITEAGLTGTYMTPELRDMYSQVLEQKKLYGAAQTAEERQAITSAANDLRTRIQMAGGNADLVGANVTLDQATSNGGKFGISTLENQRMQETNKQNEIANDAQYGGTYNGQKTAAQQQIDTQNNQWQQEFNWSKSVDNPAVKMQVWQANLAKQEAMNYPEITKREIARLDQQLQAGQIDIDTAQNQFQELVNPDSFTNKMRNLEIQATELGNQELTKRIAEIGKMPVQTDLQKRLQEIELEKAEIELTQYKESDDQRAAEYYKTMSENDRKIADNAAKNILSSGLVIPETIPGQYGQSATETGKYTVPDVNKFEAYILSIPGITDAAADSLFMQFGQGQLVGE